MNKKNILYVYEVETNCKDFNEGNSTITTYTKLHDGRTKNKIASISCAKHKIPCPILLTLISQSKGGIEK